MASNASFVTRGYGQVEPNHLSAQRTGQIYAQLPMDKNIGQLENGQFVKYNYSKGVVDFSGAGEWMLVFNEVKIYEDRQTDADFVMTPINGYGSAYIHNAAGDAVDADAVTTVNGVDVQVGAYPRVLKTNVGDICTTNTVTAKANNADFVAGELLTPANNGILGILDTTDQSYVAGAQMEWEIVKVYTLADGQKAVKIMRIA